MPDHAPLALARLWTAYRLELRLLCRHWSYLLIHGLWTLLLLGSFAANVTAEALLETTLIFATRAIISAAALFVAGNSVTRSVRARFDALEDALPAGFEASLGRWLACTTAILAFTVEPLIVGFIAGPLESFAAGVIAFVLKATILLSFTTALTWTLVGLIGPRRWVYPLLAAGWVGLLVLPTLLNNWRLPFAGLVNFSGNGMPIVYSEMFGASIQGNLPIWFYAFYFAVLLTLIGVAALRDIRRRFHRFSRRAGAWTAAALAVAVISAAGYTSLVAAAQARDRADSIVYHANANSLLLPADAPESVTAYAVTLDLSDLALPRFTAQLEVRNRGTSPLQALHLTLHHDLTITEASLPVERDRDFLTLTPPEPLQPGETLSVKLAYQGAVWQTEIFGGIPLASGFVMADGVSLSFNLGWYPLAGRVIAGGFFTPDVLLDEPARFRLNVIGAPGMTFASNLPATDDRTFSAEAAQWALLIGSPQLKRSDAETVSLVAAQRDLPAIRPVVQNVYPPLIDLLRRFFPDAPLKGVRIFSVDYPLDLPDMPATDGWVTLPTDRRFLSSLQQRYSGLDDWATFIVGPLVESIWPGDGQSPGQVLPEGGTRLRNSDETLLVNGIALFLESYRRANGDTQTIENLLKTLDDENERRYGVSVRTAPKLIGMHVALALNQVYAGGGEAATVRALRQLGRREAEVLRLSPDQIGAWLEAAARDE